MFQPKVASPQPKVTSPQPKVASPQPKVASPQPKVTSPQPKVTSPQPKVASPQPKVASLEKVIPESINDYNFASYQYKKYVRDFNGILGKRDLETAFGKGCHDEQRYGQVIDNDFFKNNIGHNVIVHSVITPSVKLSEPINWRFKLGVWREKYKSGANLSKK